MHAPALGPGREPEFHAASPRDVAQRVHEEVLERLLHAPAIRLNPRGALGAIPGNGEPRLAESRLEPIQGVAAERRPVERLLGELRRARLEPRQLEEVADQEVHPARFLEEPTHVVGALVRRDRHAGVEQRLRVAADRRERRGQLVSDVGEELAALALVLVQLLSCRREPLRHAVQLSRDPADLVPALVRDPDREIPFGHAGGEELHRAKPAHEETQEHEPRDGGGGDRHREEEEPGPGIRDAERASPGPADDLDLPEHLGAARDRVPRQDLEAAPGIAATSGCGRRRDATRRARHDGAVARAVENPGRSHRAARMREQGVQIRAVRCAGRGRDGGGQRRVGQLGARAHLPLLERLEHGRDHERLDQRSHDRGQEEGRGDGPEETAAHEPPHSDVSANRYPAPQTVWR